MLPPDGHRRCPQPPDRAARHAKVYHRVVFQHAAGNGRGKVRRQLFHLIIANETCHMQRVNAAIGKLPRHPRHRRVIAPAHARIVGIGPVAMVAMAEIRHHQTDLAQLTGTHHRTGLADHRISGIAVIHRADLASGGGDAHDFLAFLHRHGHWLFAQHVEAGLKKRLGNLKMRGVRRGDSDQINPVHARAFPRQHFRPVAIGAVCRNTQLLGIITPFNWPMIERASGKFKMPVRQSAKSVRWPDLAAFTAADHAPFQFCHVQAPQKPMDCRYSRLARASSSGVPGIDGSQSCSTVHQPSNPAASRR